MGSFKVPAAVKGLFARRGRLLAAGMRGHALLVSPPRAISHGTVRANHYAADLIFSQDFIYMLNICHLPFTNGSVTRFAAVPTVRK
jgi:hypothetical protein